MPGMWSFSSSRSCQLLGGVSTVARATIAGSPAPLAAGPGAGEGTGVGAWVTMRGAEQAATAKAAAPRSVSGFMGDPVGNGIRAI